MHPFDEQPFGPTEGPPPAAGDVEQATERPTLRFAQLLLDPRGLHVLMLAGSGMLSLGLVIWLAVIGLFDNPVIAATALGAANLGLLVGGVWIAVKTPYQLAGRSAAMLACLLLPLNLWFYDAQGLITLKDGGNLWLPALVCCGLYAAVARTLRDSLFVYAFTGGVALTGLLFLADGDVNHFWEVLAPSSLLVILGVVCIHVPRLFPETASGQPDEAFTQSDFGLAFFRAGHGLLAGGLGLLLTGRLAGRYYVALFEELGWFTQPDLATVGGVKLAAVGLVLAGAYTYVYSRLVHRGERFTVLAALCVAWAGVIGLEMLGVSVVGTLLIVTAASFLATLVGQGFNQGAVAKFGRVAVGLGGAAGALLALNRVLGGGADWMLLALTAGQAALTAVTAILSSHKQGRGVLVALTTLIGLVAGAVLNDVSQLHFVQKVELFATFAGAGLLGVGLVGWRREQPSQNGKSDSLVDANLWLGSLLTTVPITIGLLAARLTSGTSWWELMHETGVLAVGLAMIGLGVLARLRSVTLSGAFAVLTYVFSLALLIRVPEQLQSVAVYLMTGGGLLFLGAVLLSVYRDRLLAIPGRVRQAEGVFAVLKWR